MLLPEKVPAPAAVRVRPALLVDACDGRRDAGGPADRDGEAAEDDALMARIVAGDQVAFHHFAQRHIGRFLAVAQRVIGNDSDAEEVVQDALLRVWLHAPEWQSGGARVTSWVHRIVVNLALDCLRRNRGRLLSLDDAGNPADPGPDAEMLAQGRQLESFIARAIAALPARQRIALTLCCFEQMECAEAAHIMQISVSAVESLLVRGRRTLRERLQRLGQAKRRSTAWACRRDERRSTAISNTRFAASLA